MKKELVAKIVVLTIVVLCVGQVIITSFSMVFTNEKIERGDGFALVKNADAQSLSPKNVIKGNDEGPHHNMVFNMGEWWYYNVYFIGNNTELKNWFLVISYQLFSTFARIKLELFDDQNKSIGGDEVISFNDVRTSGPGVHLTFNNSSVEGEYPKWHLYAEFNGQEIVANLTFIANCLPEWLPDNTGNNFSTSSVGYYCVLNCTVYGTVSLNGTTHSVAGLGYHDHPWAPISLKKLSENQLFNYPVFWKWLRVHLENGWDLFIGKISFQKHSLVSRSGPGDICIATSRNTFYQLYWFRIDYLKTEKSSMPWITIPTQVRITAIFSDRLGMAGPIFFDLQYEARNIREDLYSENPPHFGYWTSQGNISGSIKSIRNTIPLTGWAVLETTADTRRF